MRIMLGADLQELLKALEEVGIVPAADELSLIERVRDLFFDAAGPLLLLIEIADEAIDRLFNVEFASGAGESVARAASLDLELFERDIQFSITTIKRVLTSSEFLIHDLLEAPQLREIVRRLTIFLPRYNQIIDLHDASATALGEVTGEAQTIADRIAAAKGTLDKGKAELAEDLDKAAARAEGRTTGTI